MTSKGIAVTVTLLLALTSAVPGFAETGLVWVKTVRANLREQPQSNAKTVQRLWQGTKLEVLDSADSWVKVMIRTTPLVTVRFYSKYFVDNSRSVFERTTYDVTRRRDVYDGTSDTIVGWIARTNLSVDTVIEMDSKMAWEYAERVHRERYVKDHPEWADEIKEKILSGRTAVGMTSEMAMAVLGEPTSKNRTVGTWGVHEQWVYDNYNAYLYFENGVLTSWQN